MEKSIRGLLEALSDIAPNATFGYDNDNQIVIYTNTQNTSTSYNYIEEMGEIEEWKSLARLRTLIQAL